jgi:regulatory protein
MEPPDRETLHESALYHLSRYATTAAGLTRVLDRRIARWADAAAADGDRDETRAAAAEARSLARLVVARLVETGVVDDAGFATARAQRLARAGRSRVAVAAHLSARGVDAETAEAAVAGGPADEVASALVYARRRRIGPFRAAAEVDADGAWRELAMLARAGFPRDVAVRALRMALAEAEGIVAQVVR